jgi:hypothetical protein
MDNTTEVKQMNTYKTRYLARTSEGLEWLEISLDLIPYLNDGLNEQQAIEQACEIFERNCSNLVSW